MQYFRNEEIHYGDQSFKVDAGYCGACIFSFCYYICRKPHFIKCLPVQYRTTCFKNIFNNDLSC